MEITTSLLSILFVCGIFIISLPAEYSSKVVMISEDIQRVEIPENISTLLSFAGVELPRKGNKESLTPLLYLDIVRSTTFIDSLLSENIYLTTADKNVTVSDYIAYNQERPWWNKWFGSKQWSQNDLREELMESMKINFDEDNGLVYVYISLQDPYVAQQIVTIISNHLCKYLDDHRYKIAANEYKFFLQQYEQALSQYEACRKEYLEVADHDVDATQPSLYTRQMELENKMNLLFQIYKNVELQKENAHYKCVTKKASAFVISPALAENTAQIPNSPFIFIIFLVEVSLLLWFEYCTWHSIYTPLCCLMLPYTFILTLTILLIPITDLVSFYYPSIIIWIVSLPVFAIPSLLLGYATTKAGINVQIPHYQNWTQLPKYLMYFSYIIGFAFLGRLFLTLRSSTYLFGTDGFALDLCGYGLWGHIRELCNALMILFLFHLSRKKWILVFPLILLMLPSLLYMVKGWLIIPVVAAILMKLYAGKLKLSLKLLLTATTLGFLLFLLVYMILPALGDDAAQTDSRMFEFVVNHFVHYLTSGTLGFSFDLELGATDTEDFKYLFTPFINIWNMLTGSKEILSPTPSKFFNTGYNYTNVRTFFGTLYLHCNTLQFLLCTFGYSVVGYILMYYAKIKGSIYVFMAYFFVASLFAMGWFEFYMWHLSVIEVPLLLYLLGIFVSNIDKHINRQTA